MLVNCFTGVMFVDCRNAEKQRRAAAALASRQRQASPAQLPSARSSSTSSSVSDGSSCDVSFHVPFGRSRSWTPSPILPDLPPPAPSAPVPRPEASSSSPSEGSSCDVSFHVPFGRSRSWTPSPILRISHHLRRQHQCLAPKLAVLVLPKWSCRQFVDAAGRARSRCRHLRNRKRGRTNLQSQVHLDPVLGNASCNEDVNSAVVVDAWYIWTVVGIGSTDGSTVVPGVSGNDRKLRRDSWRNGVGVGFLDREHGGSPWRVWK
jgi:hypothetical protein